ncbi:MAG: PadR family transcriptional regulator [Gemmatimonadota bacterium]|jgi:DNA-binding PadR family transcriptional regulator
MSGRDHLEEPGPLSPVAFHTLLALHGAPLHGYAVMKEVEATSGSATGPGAVYGAIQRLEEAGLIREGRRLEPSRGSRPRQEYEITERGRIALRAEARRFRRLAELVAQRKLVPGGNEP